MRPWLVFFLSVALSRPGFGQGPDARQSVSAIYKRWNAAIVAKRFLEAEKLMNSFSSPKFEYIQRDGTIWSWKQVVGSLKTLISDPTRKLVFSRSVIKRSEQHGSRMTVYVDTTYRLDTGGQYLNGVANTLDRWELAGKQWRLLEIKVLGEKITFETAKKRGLGKG